MNIILANPRGFCAGVDRAIEIVKTLLQKYGAPIYVRHELVHNSRVVADLEASGVIFVDELEQIPDDAIVVYSAHGVSSAVETEGQKRNLAVYDATCPLVSKVHHEIDRYGRQGFDCILIGHSGHAEVEGTLGRFPKGYTGSLYLVEDTDQAHKLQVAQPDKIALMCQTTLSIDDTAAIIEALKERFPLLQLPKKSDICYATQNRQDAVKQLSLEVQKVLVVGSATSSNSARLVEIAHSSGCEALRIEKFSDIPETWLSETETIGITAGASTPQVQVNELIAEVKAAISDTQAIEISGISEDVHFQLPQSLKTELQ